MMSNKINLFSIWLLILGVLVISIIIIGGYTRISDSGLSITEWEPISGILYPFSNQSWLNEFSKYKLTDEFKLINSNMTLVEFKFIYFWEWFHRFFARLIGVIFLIPLLFIIFKKQFPKQFTIHIFLIGLFLIYTYLFHLFEHLKIPQVSQSSTLIIRYRPFDGYFAPKSLSE